MGIGTIGARGGVEITHQNDETRRMISIRTAVSMALILNGITICVYLVVWLFWWWLLIRAYEPPWHCTGFCSWWGCVSFVTVEWAAVMGRTWPLWVILLPLEWPTPLLILYRRNLLPKLLNDEWPPTSGQMDPNTSGFLTAENWDARAGIGSTARDTPDREEVHVVIEDQTTTHTPRATRNMCDLFSPAGYPGNLARYAAALVRTDGSHAAFSYAGGKQINGAKFYKYTPGEFDELETEAVHAGLVNRERKNQPYQLTPRGRFAFTRIAERELVFASLSPTARA